MIRGTTAQFKFKLPYKKGEIAWATIKFWQPGNEGNTYGSLPITKRLEDCTGFDDLDEICVSLTAEETMRFSDRLKAKTQLRAQTSDGVVFASQQELITVYPINDDIVTDDPSLPPADDDGWIILDGETIA